MKNIWTLIVTAVFSVAFSTAAFATECVDSNGKNIESDPEAFQREITLKKNCYEAAKLARACSWASSVDVVTVGLAENICTAELDKLNPTLSDRALLKKMKERCSEKYAKEEGSLYRSMNAYCHLDALEWILNISMPISFF